MTTSRIIKRSVAFMGAICAAWIMFSITFLLIMSLGSMVQTVHHDGQDAFTQAAVSLFNLPTWGIATIGVMAVYAVIYITWNKEVIKQNFAKYFENFFQE